MMWGIVTQVTKGDAKLRDGRLVMEFKEGKFIDRSPYENELKLILISGCLVVETGLELMDDAPCRVAFREYLNDTCKGVYPRGWDGP